MVAGGPALFLLGTVSRRARQLLKLLSMLYIGGGFFAARSAARKQGANPALTFAAMVTMHVTYGAGFIWGAWQERQRR
jgi:hypothetical protein